MSYIFFFIYEESEFEERNSKIEKMGKKDNAKKNLKKSLNFI